MRGKPDAKKGNSSGRSGPFAAKIVADVIRSGLHHHTPFAASLALHTICSFEEHEHEHDFSSLVLFAVTDHLHLYER